MSPSSALAKSASTYSQSRDLEAEMQQLIQSRQAPLPEAEKKSAVSYCASLMPFCWAILDLNSIQLKQEMLSATLCGNAPNRSSAAVKQ